ncbi:tetratricopeptide repeat protein [Paracrocinitomix mangrovi]|uniref:tetratricopeptide repeat protein n=1 Tax=Paracrocinitomix mangrovi TaxID=2862509 RepID=UPI001C8D8A07|nr:tetratricopeptide repeat protein [Paracrocinitomix mangrovi]UKN00553.1 tetratricopeptide repeat protein [Paracrocinitomix mangrovi]
MKKLLILSSLFLAINSIAQEKNRINYDQWIMIEKGTYTRMMTTADSLLVEYESQPFEVEEAPSKCCTNGLLVIKNLYKAAMSEQKGDEDAKAGYDKVSNLIKDEKLLEGDSSTQELLKRGNEYQSTGNYKKALIFYEKALEKDPASKSIKKTIKQTKKKLKKYKQA